MLGLWGRCSCFGIALGDCVRRGVGVVGWLVNSSHPPKPLSPPLPQARRERLHNSASPDLGCLGREERWGHPPAWPLLEGPGLMCCWSPRGLGREWE